MSPGELVVLPQRVTEVEVSMQEAVPGCWDTGVKDLESPPP